MPWSMLTKTRAFIRGKNKEVWNEKRKKQLCVFVYYLYEIWQILKLFPRTFRWAKTLKLGRVENKACCIFFTSNRHTGIMYFKALLCWMPNVWAQILRDRQVWVILYRVYHNNFPFFFHLCRYSMLEMSGPIF